MDPVSIALMGGGILTSLLGQNSQNKLAKQQLSDSEANSKQQMALAEEQAKMAQAGSVDQYGNAQTYDPTTNTWKTALSATGQQMSDADRQEQLRQLQYDAPMARGEAIAAAQRRSQEGDVANSELSQLRDQISGKTAVTPASIAASLRLNRTEAAHAGMDQAKQAFNTNALRTGMGASASGAALADAAKSNADYMAQTMGNPDMEGLNAATEMNNTNRGSLTDAYAAMASRATGAPGFQYTPSGQSSSLAQSLANNKNIGVSGTGAAAGAVGNAAATALNGYKVAGPASIPNYSAPLNGLATMWSDYGGDIMSSLKKNMSSSTLGTSSNGSIADSMDI